MKHARRRIAAAFVVAACAVCAACAAGPVRAQMTPTGDTRQITAHAHRGGLSNTDVRTPPSSYAFWTDNAHASVEDAATGETHSDATQSSGFSPSYIALYGHADGGWSGEQSGTYDSESYGRLRAHGAACSEFHFDGHVLPGDTRRAFIEVRGPAGLYIRVEEGDSSLVGRLPSGDYTWEGDAVVPSTGAAFTDGGTFSLTWACVPCSGNFIQQEPSDATGDCNNSAGFCVTPAASGGPFTYQWRHNGVALTNNGHFSGVNSPCLGIAHACYADAQGPYDCQVTGTANGGPLTQFSRATQLTISGIVAGVGPGVGGLSLAPAAPNPATAGTAVHYAAPAPFFARVTIHDAAGRIVRRLAERVLDAAGTLAWDGRTAAGTPAAAGVYFLRVETAQGAASRRIALVR